MRILIICDSFGKGHAATAHLATELAEGFVEHGCSVVVWSRGETKEHPVASCGKVIVVQGCDYNLPFKVSANRHIGEALLMLGFCVRAQTTRSIFDRIICMDSPRFSPLAARILSRRTGAKTYAWIMDLAFEQVGRRATGLRKLIATTLMRLQVFLWNKLDRIVTLGSCMASVLQVRGMPAEKIHVIGTWAEDHWADLNFDTTRAKDRFSIINRFTVLYSGYAGTWHDFNSVCDAISELGVDSAVQWVFAGSGPGIGQVRRHADVLGFKNVIFLQRVDREDLPEFLSSADIHLVSLHQSMSGTCSPSKLYPLMALGKAIVFVGPRDCQTALDLEGAGAGVVVDNAEALAYAITTLAVDPVRLNQMGGNGRAAFRLKHNSTSAVNRWLALLNGSASSS